MPNPAVDVNSWAGSACYPRRTFYPLSDGPSIQNRRITKADFRPCSRCPSHSQAGLCLCTQRVVSKHAEPTIARLRYSLGGDRPSQTTRHAGSRTRITGRGETASTPRVVFQGCLHASWRLRFDGSHLSYTWPACCQCKAVVKVHGVFPSDRGSPASSRAVQFR